MSSKPFACWVCGKTVQLENCKVDEHGLPVHAACYVVRVALASRKAQTADSPGAKRSKDAVARRDVR